MRGSIESQYGSVTDLQLSLSQRTCIWVNPPTLLLSRCLYLCRSGAVEIHGLVKRPLTEMEQQHRFDKTMF